jgi:hypothetical protein
MADLFPDTKPAELDFKPVNTHNLICDFGKKHKGTKWTDVPVGYLRWIVNSVDKEDIVLIAKSELHRRGRLAEMPKLEVSGHALDRISQRMLSAWQEECPKAEPGLSTWAHEKAGEALSMGDLQESDDPSVTILHYQGIKWVFAIGNEWPSLKTVRRI